MFGPDVDIFVFLQWFNRGGPIFLFLLIYFTDMIQILVIDDEDPIRNLLARMIELEGYKVWKAPSGRHARN